MSAALSLALRFVREDTPESSARLCGVLCCATGCVCGLGTIAFAFCNPTQAPTVGALAGVITALIAAGGVALLTRKRKTSAGGAP